MLDEICKGVTISSPALYVSCANYNRVQIHIPWQEGRTCGKPLDNAPCDYTQAKHECEHHGFPDADYYSSEGGLFSVNGGPRSAITTLICKRSKEMP